MFFGGGGIYYWIIHQLIDSIVKIHINKEVLHNNYFTVVDLHNCFKIFTPLLLFTGRHMFNSNKLDTARKSKPTTRAIKLCNFKNPLSQQHKPSILSSFCWTIFYLLPERSGLNMVWKLVMSVAVIGKFWIMLLLNMDLKYLFGCMENNFLGFAGEFFLRNVFLDESFKVITDSL